MLSSIQAQDSFLPPLLIEVSSDSPEFIIPPQQAFSFKQIGGIILVSASIDGAEKDFILDTGASSLILNTKPVKMSKKLTAVGVNGHTAIQELTVEDFEWNVIKAQNVDAYVIDLSHIEKLLKQPIGGLIGKNIIEDKELYIDYASQKIILFDAANRPNFEGAKVVKRIPFELDNHFPILKVKIGNRNYRFALDTGCEINLLSKDLIEKIKTKQYEVLEKRRLNGAGAETTAGMNCLFDKIKIKGQSYKNIQLVTTSLAHLNSDPANNIDGILGYPFLSQFKVSINFEEQAFYIWE